LILEAESSSALFGALYRARKAENSKFSLQYLCAKAKVPSKGYLSDVMAGRRRLSPAYAKGLAEALGLSGAEKKIFVTMAELESEASPHRRGILEKRLRSCKAQLQTNLTDLPESARSPLLFTRAFCALGIFVSPPTREQVAKLFPEETPGAVHEALDSLIRCGAVAEEGGKLRVVSQEVRFGEGNPTEANLLYLEQSMQLSQKNLRKWFARKEESYFESCTVSVRKSRYLEILPRLKEAMDSLLTEMEEPSGADELVHFGIQLFPEEVFQKPIS
jgi:uncharacterized protein (TIGR02147 family)